MVKVEIEGHELKNGDIEKLSLVTHGAIRQPFKILKTEEIPASSGTASLKKTLGNIFGQDHTHDDEDRVAALFVRKSVAQKWLPLIRKQGFRAEKEHASIEGDILVLKQEGFTDECDGSVIALNPDVAVQLSTVSKYFDPFPASSSFADNVAAGSFWPGMHNAMESLAETVWNVLNESDSPEDAASDVAKQVKAFSSHLNNLVTELPGTVFKMEQESLTKEFASSTVPVSVTQTNVSSEDANMSTVVTKHAPATDLDGLFDEAPAADETVEKTDDADESTQTLIQMFSGEEQLTKEAYDALADDAEVIVKEEGKEDAVWVKSEIEKGDEGAPKSGGSPGNPVVDNTSDTGAVSLDEGGVPAGFRKEERTMKSFDDKGNIVEKFAEFLINEENGEEIFVKFIEALSAPDGDKKTDYTDAQNALFAQMGVMVKGIEALTEAVNGQNTRIDAVEKAADTAQETADNTVLIPTAAEDLGNAIQSASGQTPIQKDAAGAATGEVVDIWKGALPQLESNAA